MQSPRTRPTEHPADTRRVLEMDSRASQRGAYAPPDHGCPSNPAMQGTTPGCTLTAQNSPPWRGAAALHPH